MLAKPFHIDISEEEFQATLIAIEAFPGKISIHQLADRMGINVNHLRYVMDELVKNKKVNKIVVDDRPGHKRYRYEVAK